MTDPSAPHEPSRPVRLFVFLYFLILLGPLFAAAVSRPFTLWDDLTIPYKLQDGFAHSLRDYPSAVEYYFFTKNYVFRPVILSFYNLFYLVFGGEFWVLQILKWCVRGGYLYLTDQLLRRFAFTGWTRLFVFTFLLFHPALQDIMLFSDDSWLALSITALLAFLVRRPHFLDLNRLTLKEYAVFLALFLAALGMKEVAVAFGLVLAAAVTYRSRKGGPWLAAPLWILLALWIWRLYTMVMSPFRVNMPKPSTGKLDVLLAHLSYLPTPSPFHLLALMFAAAIGWGAYRILRTGSCELKWMAGLSMAASAAMLLFTSNVETPAIRYIISSAVLLAIPLAAGVEKLPAAVKMAFVAAFPLLMAGHSYSQALAFQQFAGETAEIVTAMERSAQEGRALHMAPDFGGEFEISLSLYFKSVGPRAYDAPSATPATAGETIPPGPVTMLSTTKTEWRDRPGYRSRAQSVECFPKDRLGILQKFRTLYSDLQERLRLVPSMYDFGGPTVSYPCTFFLHTLGSAPAAEPLEQHAAKAGDEVRITRKLGDLTTLNEAMYWGSVRIAEGSARLAVLDAAGRTRWSVKLEPGAEWKTLPMPPAGIAGGRNLTLSLSLSGPGRMELKGFGAAPVYVRAPARRYGAILR